MKYWYHPIPYACIIAAVVIGIWAYGQLPEEVAVHWNAAGEADGYSSRFMGAFLLPAIMAGTYALLQILPKIDPKAKNIERFEAHWQQFLSIFMVFLLYLYLVTLAWNFRSDISLPRYLALGCGFLWLAIGRLMRHTEPNFTIGIRTPWTLANKEVWRQTHARAARYFIAAGLVSFVGVIRPTLAAWCVIGSIIAVTFLSVGQSYFLFRRLDKRNQHSRTR